MNARSPGCGLHGGGAHPQHRPKLPQAASSSVHFWGRRLQADSRPMCAAVLPTPPPTSLWVPGHNLVGEPCPDVCWPEFDQVWPGVGHLPPRLDQGRPHVARLRPSLLDVGQMRATGGGGTMMMLGRVFDTEPALKRHRAQPRSTPEWRRMEPGAVPKPFRVTDPDLARTAPQSTPDRCRTNSESIQDRSRIGPGRPHHRSCVNPARRRKQTHCFGSVNPRDRSEKRDLDRYRPRGQSESSRSIPKNSVGAAVARQRSGIIATIVHLVDGVPHCEHASRQGPLSTITVTITAVCT